MAFEREVGEFAGREIKDGIKYFSHALVAIWNAYATSRWGSGATLVNKVGLV